VQATALHSVVPKSPRRTSLPAATASARVHRTRAEYDAERSAVTRERILEAASQTLLDVGYARSTTVEIGRRAGVARGTLLHHFPTHQALMVASIGHVFHRRWVAFDQEARRLTDASGGEGRPSTETLVDLLWRALDEGDTTLAWVELVVAARHDEALHQELVRLMEAFDDLVAESFSRWVPGAAGAEPPRRLVLALMNGLVLDRMMGLDQHVPAVLTLLKQLARLVVPPA